MQRYIKLVISSQITHESLEGNVRKTQFVIRIDGSLV